jgi:hypothetical protein
MEGWVANLGLLNYIFIAFLLGPAACGQTASRALTWAEHPRLSWNDFHGRARRNTGEPSAVTATGFRVQLECREGTLDIHVEAEFYGNSSWVKEARKSVELLRHEQVHFDITELYARKLRKAIREARIGCEDDRRAEAAGKKIFEQLDREWEREEKEYDAETRDGTDLVRQKEMSEMIASELAELSGFRL